MQNINFSLKTRWLVTIILLLSFGIDHAWSTTYTYNLSANTAGNGGAVTYWYSNVGCTTHVCKYYNDKSGDHNILSSSSSTYNMYYKDATLTSHAFVLCAPNTAYFMNTSCLFLGKSGAYLSLPTYAGEKITTVKVTTGSGCSTKVSFNIYSSSAAASTAVTTPAVSTEYTFNISSTYQNSALKLQVTNANNLQITQIAVITEAAPSCSNPAAPNNSSFL